MTGKQAKRVKAAAKRAYREGRHEEFWLWRSMRPPFADPPGTYAEQMTALGETA